jgi:hypothetical protein
MTFETFEKVVRALERERDSAHQLYSLGVDLMTYVESIHQAISVLLESVFQEEGKDWIDWYLYERKSLVDGKYLQAFDADGKEICHNIESLWETVKPYTQTHAKEKGKKK